jgi:TonB family protein
MKSLAVALLLAVGVGASAVLAQTADKEWTDSYRPGGGVTVPKLIREVKPNYTAAAVGAKIEGAVWVECVVEIDGTVRRARVARSLDRRFGLDEQAVAAAKQWRFEPGTKDGVPIPVVVTIELVFTLRKDAAAPLALPAAFSDGAARRVPDDAWRVSTIDTPTLTITVGHPDDWTKAQDVPGLELTLGAPDAAMGVLLVSPNPTTLPDMPPVPLENLRQAGAAIAASFKRPLRSVGQARVGRRVWFWCDLGTAETGGKDRMWIFSTINTGHEVVVGFFMPADASEAETLRAGGIFARMLDRLSFTRRTQPSR